jgi:hypothetical protein
MSETFMPSSVFSKGTVVLDYKAVRFNPCDDLIFPGVIRAADCFPQPLAKYYMYYAPHNAPGGICLASADALEGPWREFEHNPLITNVWPPHYHVGHISSPHAIWVPEASRLFLYYHGDNDTTRYATSEDGLAFEYGGVAVDKEDFERFTGISSRVFYAKVFRHASPSGRGRYAMLFMASYYSPKSPGDPSMHGLYAAWSHDARTWRLASGTILQQSDLGPNEYVCSPCLFSWGGRHHVLYHRDRANASVEDKVQTDVYRVEVNANLERTGPQVLVCRRQAFGDDNLRVSDPCVLVEGDEVYLFSSVGPRLNQRIGLAKARVDEALG